MPKIKNLRVTEDIKNGVSKVEVLMEGITSYHELGEFHTKNILLDNREIIELVRDMEFASVAYAQFILRQIFSGIIDYGKLTAIGTISLEKARDIISRNNDDIDSIYYMNRVYLTESEDGKKSLCLKLYNLFGVEPFKMCFNITNFKEVTYLDILKRIDQFNYNTTKNLLTKTFGIGNVIMAICDHFNFQYIDKTFDIIRPPCGAGETIHLDVMPKGFIVLGINSSFVEDDRSLSSVYITYSFDGEMKKVDIGRIPNKSVGSLLNDILLRQGMSSLKELVQFVSKFKHTYGIK